MENEQWLESFQKAYGAPDRISDLACPNCSARQLRLRYHSSAQVPI
jgi:hypothetical protein